LKDIKLLILEDNLEDAALMKATLKKSGLHFNIKEVSSRKDFINALDSFAPEILLSDQNGELIAMETTAHYMDYNNRKARMVVANDVTEKQKAEHELLQTQVRLKQSQEIANIYKILYKK
jgi:hypothetical protein